MVSIRTSIRAYETWLREELKGDIVEADLKAKHKDMKKAAFIFLRATCFRWAETARDICPELAGAPAVLAVGDAHVENFGLWRDDEGRLIWGVNDFDEAAETPYTFDLVRLGASAVLAQTKSADLSPARAAAAILSGYRAGLKNPRAFILENEHFRLRDLFAAGDRRRASFWHDLAALKAAAPPGRFLSALQEALPSPKPKTALKRRRAGVGSLGRPRFVALATFRGGPLAREAKALVPSCWARNDQQHKFLAIARGAYRSPDPWLDVNGEVVVRRLAPNSRKLDFDSGRLEVRRDVLNAMAFELANVHAGSTCATARIEADLDGRAKRWLEQAVAATIEATERDFNAYKRG